MPENTAHNSLSRLLTPQEVSDMLGVSTETLSTWRATNRYPLPYVKAGRLVRYRMSDIKHFIEGRVKNPSS